MAELDDLRGRTFEWSLKGDSPLEAVLYEGNLPIGRIHSPADRPMAFADLAGVALKIAWTEHAYYRMAFADTGLHVGEARRLPWRPATFQAKLDGIRAYRLHHASSRAASWRLGAEDAIRFDQPFLGAQEGTVEVSSSIEPADVPPLLALGVLMWSGGRLFSEQIGSSVAEAPSPPISGDYGGEGASAT